MFDGGVGGAAALMARPAFGRAPASYPVAPPAAWSWDPPDLGHDIGSARWWRGLLICLLLCATTIALAPGFEPLVVADRAAVGTAREARALAIAPLGLGGDSGRRMDATDAVQPLPGVPDRPRLDLVATIGSGDGLVHALERAGVGSAEASRIAGMTATVADPGALAPGTALSIVLGKRAAPSLPRPVDALSFRAAFDMNLAFTRTAGGALTMLRQPIAVVRAPLRITGRVGDGLYLSARAAGAPATTLQTYIRALAPRVPMSDLAPDDRFDLIVEQARAATGEVRYGRLLYVGLVRGDRAMQLIEWTIDGRRGWYDAAGVAEQRTGFVTPIEGGRQTSGYGMRFHPLLRYSRMHQGTDYAAVYGTPIRAVTDGTVSFAGWHGGHGQMVKLAHDGGMGSGYAHMSRIAVGPGARVAQGQVIGYVGSSGLSTGPHLHFEVYRGGVPISPAGVSFAARALLSGEALAAFRARLALLTTVR